MRLAFLFILILTFNACDDDQSGAQEGAEKQVVPLDGGEEVPQGASAIPVNAGRSGAQEGAEKQVVPSDGEEEVPQGASAIPVNAKRSEAQERKRIGYWLYGIETVLITNPDGTEIIEYTKYTNKGTEETITLPADTEMTDEYWHGVFKIVLPNRKTILQISKGGGEKVIIPDTFDKDNIDINQNIAETIKGAFIEQTNTTPDGTKIVTYKDGTVMTYLDGIQTFTYTTTNPAGPTVELSLSYLVKEYENGYGRRLLRKEIRRTYSDGEMIVTKSGRTRRDRITITTLANGSKRIDYNDTGVSFTIEPSGIEKWSIPHYPNIILPYQPEITKEIIKNDFSPLKAIETRTYSDGTVIQLSSEEFLGGFSPDPDVIKITLPDDGVIIERYSDTTVARYPDGTIIETYNNGSEAVIKPGANPGLPFFLMNRLDKYPAGTRWIYEEDGTQIVEYPDGREEIKGI